MEKINEKNEFWTNLLVNILGCLIGYLIALGILRAFGADEISLIRSEIETLKTEVEELKRNPPEMESKNDILLLKIKEMEEILSENK